MPRPRTPQAKAEISGANVVNPARFADRKGPRTTRPLGNPYERMTDPQKVAWEEVRTEAPWLNSSHRPLVRMAAQIMARMDEDGEIGMTAMKTLSAILSKLGMTPVDETKVNHGAGDSEEPEDKFFGRPN